MKVSVARIRLYLKEGKTLADGSHPIMLMCSFNGRKEVSTGYSCTTKYWDKKSECIKRGYSNFVIINQTLKQMKDEAISKRDKYIASGELYTPSMILAKDDVRNAVTNDFCGLIERYIDEKGLEDKTIEKWRIIKRNVIQYCGRKDLLINEIDEAFCRRYCRWLENERKLSDGSIRSYLAKVGAICHYAISKGLMSEHPFKSWKYHKDYRDSKNELYIHSRTLDVMMEMFLNECIERDGNRWRYREGVIEQLLDIHSELYSHYLYAAGYYLCGISPVDLSLYKKKDIRVRDVNGKSYYYFNGHREKTSMEYRFYIPQGTTESNVMIRTMLMFVQGEYFLPTLCGYVGKDVKKRINNVYSYHSEHLVNWFQRVNEEIVRRNVAGDNIELIDLECRYYSYRHSRIMAEIQKPNVNLLKIATITGKSIKTIHQYLTLLGENDLVL